MVGNGQQGPRARNDTRTRDGPAGYNGDLYFGESVMMDVGMEDLGPASNDEEGALFGELSSMIRPNVSSYLMERNAIFSSDRRVPSTAGRVDNNGKPFVKAPKDKIVHQNFFNQFDDLLDMDDL